MIRVGRAGPAVAAALLIAAACSSYGSGSPDTSSDAGGGDDAPSDAPPFGDGGDGGAPIDSALSPLCPPPDGPDCGTGLATSCARVPLFTPSRSEFVYGVATDASYVYWIAQFVTDAAPGDPSNGTGYGRIRRVARDGSGVTVLSDGETHATEIALDGEYVYWVAETAAADTSFIRRVPRACSDPCPLPEVVATIEKGGISHLASAPGALFATTLDGTLYRITLGSSAVVTDLKAGLGQYAGIALTSDYVYGASPYQPNVARVEIATGATVVDWATLPVDDAAVPDKGLHGATTDCSGLWGVGGDPIVLERVDLGDGGLLRTTGGPILANLAAIGADARYVYFASLAGGGINVYDKTTNTTDTLAPGSVWRLVVDAHGVYWGEHDGSGVLRMLQK